MSTRVLHFRWRVGSISLGDQEGAQWALNQSQGYNAMRNGPAADDGKVRVNENFQASFSFVWTRNNLVITGENQSESKFESEGASFKFLEHEDVRRMRER